MRRKEVAARPCLCTLTLLAGPRPRGELGGLQRSGQLWALIGMPSDAALRKQGHTLARLALWIEHQPAD